MNSNGTIKSIFMNNLSLKTVVNVNPDESANTNPIFFSEPEVDFAKIEKGRIFNKT